MMIRTLSAIALVAAAATAQITPPGYNVTLDPDGTQRNWFGGHWNGEPAVFVWGPAGQFVEFTAPQLQPPGTIALELELAAWGLIDGRPCAASSTAGFTAANLCTTTSTGFCNASYGFEVSTPVATTGLLFPAATPASPWSASWRAPLSPYAPALGPTRFRMSYCSSDGCQSPCSFGGLYPVFYSEPELMLAAFVLR